MFEGDGASESIIARKRPDRLGENAFEVIQELTDYPERGVLGRALELPKAGTTLGDRQPELAAVGEVAMLTQGNREILPARLDS